MKGLRYLEVYNVVNRVTGNLNRFVREVFPPAKKAGIVGLISIVFLRSIECTVSKYTKKVNRKAHYWDTCLNTGLLSYHLCCYNL